MSVYSKYKVSFVLCQSLRMVKQIIECIVCALKHAKNDTTTHGHDMNHGVCLFVLEDTMKM